MASPNNRGDNVPTRHFIPPSKTCSDRNGLYLVESLAKGAPWKPLNIACYCHGYSLQPDGKAILHKRTHTYVTEQGEVKVASNQKLYNYWFMFIVLKIILSTIRGERLTSTQVQNPWPTAVAGLWEILVQLWHKRYGSHQPVFDGI